jgi:hypothetical protein
MMRKSERAEYGFLSPNLREGYAEQIEREKKAAAAKAQRIKWGLETPALYSDEDVADVNRALRAARSK